MLQKIGLILTVIVILPFVLNAQQTFKVVNPDTTTATIDTVKADAVSDYISTSDSNDVMPVKTAVAVLELDPNGVTESEAKALSDRLRIEIFNAGVYEVMEREKMNRILDEMQFQLKDCTSDDCAIEIGRLVGVKKIIAGSISKIGELYTVSARLIDVETSKIEATAIEDVEGTLGIVLTKAIPSIAMKISGKSGLDIQAEIKKSSVSISVDPAYSSIYINGIYMGKSPVKIELEPAEDYVLRAESDGYEPLEKHFSISKEQQLDININLSKIVEPTVITERPKKQKRSISKGFRLKYIVTGSENEINHLISSINAFTNDHNKLFKEIIPTGTNYSNIKSFKGIEVYNSSSVEDNIGFEFGLGLFRADLDDWFSEIGKGNNSGYNLVTWSPQIMLDLRIAPIRYPLFYPFFDVGFGYNLLILNAYHGEKSLGGPIYQSWGFIYGIGFEIRPVRLFGVALEWSRKNLDMQLMDVDAVTDRFKDYGMDSIDLTGNRIGVTLNFYY